MNDLDERQAFWDRAEADPMKDLADACDAVEAEAARPLDPLNINRDSKCYLSPPGFVEAWQKARAEEAAAKRDLDEKINDLTGVRRTHIEDQIERIQETLDALLRRLPPEEVAALFVAVRGYE